MQLFNYQANHIIISLGVSLILSWVVSDSVAFVIPTLFYFVRELYQYFALGRTKTFDWGGIVPVVIAQLLAFLLCVT